MRRLIIALVLLTFVASAHAQKGTPAEQRQWAVDTTVWLETHPLSPEARSRAAELLTWWANVPDLTLSFCSTLPETKNKGVTPAVVGQTIFGAGAYLIQHPDSSHTDQATAGLESALRAYTNAVAANPKMQDDALDKLLALQKEGKLRSYVEPLIAKCEAKH